MSLLQVLKHLITEEAGILCNLKTSFVVQMCLAGFFRIVSNNVFHMQVMQMLDQFSLRFFNFIGFPKSKVCFIASEL